MESKAIIWWKDHFLRERYEMLKRFYPNFTGIVTEEMIEKMMEQVTSEVKPKSILYTEEEVVNLCKKAYNYGFSGGFAEGTDRESKMHDCESFDFWFEDNKKQS